MARRPASPVPGSALAMLDVKPKSGPRCPLCPGGPYAAAHDELLAAVSEKGWRRSWRAMTKWIRAVVPDCSLSETTLQRHAQEEGKSKWGPYLEAVR